MLDGYVFRAHIWKLREKKMYFHACVLTHNVYVIFACVYVFVSHSNVYANGALFNMCKRTLMME